MRYMKLPLINRNLTGAVPNDYSMLNHIRRISILLVLLEWFANKPV